MVTRSLLADKLVHNILWLYESSLLTESTSQNEESNTLNTGMKEINTESTVYLNVQRLPVPYFLDSAKYGELSIVLRVTAYVLRFIKNRRNSENKMENPSP